MPKISKPQLNLKSAVAKTKLRDKKGHFVKSEVPKQEPQNQEKTTLYPTANAVILDTNFDQSLKNIAQILQDINISMNSKKNSLALAKYFALIITGLCLFFLGFLAAKSLY